MVIRPGGGGVLFHEACGHGLEADLIAKDASVFKDRRGEQVASPARHARRRRHRRPPSGARSAVDDEGTPAQRNVLIQDGILTDYMWDFLRSRKEGRPRSGNGRRQSYQHLPMVRMTNTFILDGPDDPDEIVPGTEHGVYVAKLGGGQVNTATGDFVFGMTEAYLIENGEITEPLREGNLIGNGPDVLQTSTPWATTSEFGPPGTCGKDGQGVPVGDGVPTLRVTELTDRRYGGMTRSELAIDLLRSPIGSSAGRTTASRSRRSSARAAPPRSGSTRATSSRCRRPSRQGLGVRVIADGRQGFAYVGSLDPDVLHEVLDEARDNAGFGTPDEFLGLAEPDGVPRARPRPVRDRAVRRPHRPQGGAGPRPRAARPRRPTRGSAASRRPSTPTA